MRKTGSLHRANLEDQKVNESRKKAIFEKENEFRHRETESTEAVEAMGEMFEAIESGETEIVNGKLHMPQ